MATEKETEMTQEVTESIKLDRGSKPIEMIKQAFELKPGSKSAKENLEKLPYIKGINENTNKFDASFLCSKVKSFIKDIDDDTDYQALSYADAALLAKAIATTQHEYMTTMAIIVKEMIVQTLAAVKAGKYFPLIKNGKEVEYAKDKMYLDRFVSRASTVIKSDAQTIVTKGPYFVFGWVDDQND